MRKFLLYIFLLLFVISANAQVETYSDYSYKSNSYDAVVIKIDTGNIKKINILQNKNALLNLDFIQSLSVDSLFILINAYPFDSLCSPLGYFIKDYQLIRDVNLADGNTNFYLKPNGLLLITDNDAVICESSELNKYPKIRLGFQSGPMLLIKGKPNPQFNASSSNKNIRCGVGIFTGANNIKYLVFGASNNPVNFFEFTGFLKNKFNCQNALCLQSSGCTMNFPGQPTHRQIYNGFICSYIYFKI